MVKRGRLIIVSSPSGGGKTSVIRRFLSTHPNMVHSVSWTTRPMRTNEIDGKDYHFITRTEFEKGVKEEKFAEWEEVHGNFYGTPKEPLDKWLSEGRDVLLDLDVKGGLKLKALYKDDAISVFILPPSENVLRERLIGRKTDSAEVQALRLKNAIEEMRYKDKFDFQVVNDELEGACGEIEGILGGLPRRPSASSQ